MVDEKHCDVIFTTGGTGPAPRDITPEATLAVLDKELPGFGEQMRRISLHYVPTVILSRQTAGIRGSSLIVNLPGRPRAIAETLGGVRAEDGSVAVPGLFGAVPYCVDLIGGGFIETDVAVCPAFRPKKNKPLALFLGYLKAVSAFLPLPESGNGIFQITIQKI